MLSFIIKNRGGKLLAWSDKQAKLVVELPAVGVEEWDTFLISCEVKWEGMSGTSASGVSF